MGLFDKFKKEKKYALPEMYNGIVTKEEYNIVMEIAVKYHTENGFVITKIDEGEIVTNVNGDEQHRYLDNLVRILAMHEKTEWQRLIFDHFDKIKDNSSAYYYLYKDFEYASQFLRVLIKEDIFDLGDEISNFVHYSHFPKTNTFLVLEFEGQFSFVRKADIVEWEKTEEELFEIAIANTPENEIEVKEYEFANKFSVFFFTSGDFAASLMLDIENRASYTIGNFGTLIAIPSKRTAYAHPIESGDILELIENISPAVDGFFKDDPGSVTQNYYWYYRGRYQIFPIRQDDKGQLIRMPDELVKLMGYQP